MNSLRDVISFHEEHSEDGKFLVQTSEGPLDVTTATVEQWVDLDPQVELALKRKSDGLLIVFAPNAESYRALVAKGVVVFSPAEVLRIIEARNAADGETGMLARGELLEAAVKLKQTFPGAKLGELNDKGSGS